MSRGERETRRKIVAVAGDEAHAGGVASRYDAEAVVLDLMNPIRPGRRLFGRTRQTRLEAG
jgi:DNA-binding response OmpR family regulator